MHKQKKQPYLLRMLIHVWSQRKPAPISILSLKRFQPDQYPTTNDRDIWHNYWQEMGQSWRTEPEIDKRRQVYLEKRHAIVPNIEQGSYPFKNLKLSRADVEWLLATHENGRGPVNWDDKNQRVRKGLDLRGANLSYVDLHNLPLARILGGLTWDQWEIASDDQRRMAAIHLEGADLRWAHLERAYLGAAYLRQTRLEGAHLERAFLIWARLEGADLRWAYLERADLDVAHLEGADLRGAYLQLSYLNEVFLGDTQLISPQLADVHWTDVNLAVVDWSQIEILGDEYEAKLKLVDGKEKDSNIRLKDYAQAVRANRQLAVALQAQGLDEVSVRFAYRAHVLQKNVLWLQMLQPNLKFAQRLRRLGSWLFSWFLYLLAGYGYRPGRSVIVYLLMISIFAVIYFVFGMATTGTQHLQWYEALVVSLTAFHGRGFFSEQFKPGDPQAFVAAVEAVVGLVIEISFIATFTQRFFGR